MVERIKNLEKTTTLVLVTDDETVTDELLLTTDVDTAVLDTYNRCTNR